MATTRKSAAKKPAAKKKNTAARKRTKQIAPSGSRLGAAQQAARDSLMIARLAQDWTWPAIAAEADISVTAAKKAVKARQENAPLALSQDPVKIIEEVMRGFQLSVGDFEAMSSAALYDENNISSAVGAKKGANDAREKMLMLLQMTGRLPQELGALRHLIDIRAIAVRMLDTMDQFERTVLEIELDAKTRKAITAGVLHVRSTFNELIGLEDPEETPALVA